MEIKVKKMHPNAVIPKYSREGDAGLDLVATSRSATLDSDGYLEYGVGLSFEIPNGYVGLLFPRSSISKTCLSLSNSVGVIDSGYRGEVKFRFKLSTPAFHRAYEIGDRVGQLVIIPHPVVELQDAEELMDSERGEGAYGSTGA